MTERYPDFTNPVIDSNGNVISGAKLDFFITGTSTLKDTYTSSAKTTPNANPVIADSGGRFPEIFMDTDAAYKVVLKDAADVEIWSKDPVYPILPPGTFPIIAVSSKSSNYTVIATDRGSDILVDASSGPATITLLPVVTAASGFVLTVVKTDSSANVVTVDANAAELIGSATTVGLGEQFDTIEIGTEATFWYIKSEKRLPTPQVANADEIVTVNPGGTGFITTSNPLPPRHITGLTLSNNTTDATNDIDIAAGECRDDANTANVALAAAVGKQLDVSWSAGGTPGAPTGGLSSSLTLTNDTTYHAIAGLVSGSAEIGFDTSITGANLVTDHSFTNTRCIGSVNRLTAINQVFFQIGDDFLIESALGFQDTTPAATAETQTLAGVPTGRKVRAKISAALDDASTGASIFGLASSLDVPDVAPSASSHNYVESLGNVTTLRSSSTLDIWTNTSAQIRTRHSAAPGGVTLDMSVHGWMDRRGQDG